jgi:flavin reductase (DIM6/NTAB) family NADH-FMN oxidoreductase RutF
VDKEIVYDRNVLLSTFPAFPTVLITSQDNIITVTLIHIFSFSPLLIGIGIKPERYSYSLIKDSKEFIVNIPTEEMLKEVIFCGTKSGREYDKFKETRLSKERSLELKSASIKECPVNIECRVVEEISVGDRTWFIGEVLKGKVASGYETEKALLYWHGVYRLVGPPLR